MVGKRLKKQRARKKKKSKGHGSSGRTKDTKGQIQLIILFTSCVCVITQDLDIVGHPDLHLSTCSYEISLILPRVLSLCSCRRPLLSCCPAATGRTEKPITNYHLPFTSYRFYLATCKTVSAQSSTQETVHR